MFGLTGPLSRETSCTCRRSFSRLPASSSSCVGGCKYHQQPMAASVVRISSDRRLNWRKNRHQRRRGFGRSSMGSDICHPHFVGRVSRRDAETQRSKDREKLRLSVPCLLCVSASLREAFAFHL